MSGKVVRKPQVYSDLDEMAAYIQKDSPRAALRFLENAETTFHKLAETPGLGGYYVTANPRLTNLKCFPIIGFPNHLVFYLPTGDGIDVIRVIHGARDIQSILTIEPS